MEIYCTQCLLPIRMYYFNDLIGLNVHACGNRRCAKFKETLYYSKRDNNAPPEPHCLGCEG